MPKIAHLFRAPKKRLPMEPLLAASILENHGIEGCAHARPNGSRQVLIVDVETLNAMDLQPGVIRENITTEGLNVNGLSIGQRLQVGESLMEVTAVCTPCDQLEKVRQGLRRELYGRRGMLCRVIKGGTVTPGDLIERL
jgi:MOSC domain-containing protein YiiM